MQTCAARQPDVEIFNLNVLVLSFFNLVGKNPSHAFDCPSFPRAHLRWVELPLGRNLLKRLVTAQRFKRYSGLKVIGKIPSLCHSRIHSFG
jgi:CRISPR/Cas system endoribonuclease Cas6 (RAMP superfamily)